MQKYFQLFKLGFSEAVSYRTRIFVWVLQSVVWIVVLPFVWLSIYKTQDTIAGYNAHMLVSYFFFLPLIEAFTIYHVYSDIQDEVQEGTIVNYITKPIVYLVYQFFANVGFKLFGIVFPVLIMLFVYPFISEYILFPTFNLHLLWIIPVLILGSLVGFLSTTLIGMVAFWTTRAEWAMHIWWMTSSIVAGFIAPIAFYPEYLQKIIALTPFPLLIQTPVSLLLGKLSTSEVYSSLLLGSGWVVALIAVNALMYSRGVRRLEGVGI